MHSFMNTFVKLLNVVGTIAWHYGDESIHSNVSMVPAKNLLIVVSN